MSSVHDKYMKIALKLAMLGGRAVAPNPRVGALVVKGGKIIGKGYHQVFGGPHAEVNAIQSVRDKSQLKGATLYVTLEPCKHFGKTPPCSDFIEKTGIKKVVVGYPDPFQHAFKKRISYKLEFMTGDVAERCGELNKFFFTWVEKKRPYITVKIAMTADGFVAGINGERVQITSASQDKKVHQMRADHQVILTGVNTILADDPQLNVRYSKGENPLRVILDSKLRIPFGAKVLRDKNVLIATSQSADPKKLRELRNLGYEIWISPSAKHVSLQTLFAYLAKRGVSSVLVEPGPTLYHALQQAHLVDELVFFVGKKNLKAGMKLNA